MTITVKSNGTKVTVMNTDTCQIDTYHLSQYKVTIENGRVSASLLEGISEQNCEVIDSSSDSDCDEH